jgi:hypothetical protein
MAGSAHCTAIVSCAAAANASILLLLSSVVLPLLSSLLLALINALLLLLLFLLIPHGVTTRMLSITSGLRDKRSCTLVPECISASKSTLKMTAQGAVSEVSEGGPVEVQCAPIADILARYTNSTRNHVDLWILDVEGYELTVLEATDFSITHVDVMLIEDWWLHPRPSSLDVAMGVKGFIKFQQLAVDSVYLRRNASLTPANPTWLYPKFQDDQKWAHGWANSASMQAALKKGWGWT